MTRPLDPRDDDALDADLLSVLAELRGEGRDPRRFSAGRAAVMAAAARAREAAAVAPGGRRLRWRRRIAIGAFGFAGANLALGGVVALAAGAQPDSILYGVKRAAEATALSLTFDPVDKAKLELQIAGRRADEAATMARNGRADLALDAARDATGLVREASATLSANPSVDNEQALAHASAEAMDRLQAVFAALENGTDPGAAEAARSLDDAWSNGLGLGALGQQGTEGQGQGPGGEAGKGGTPAGGQSPPATPPVQSGSDSSGSHTGSGGHPTHTPPPH